MKKNRFIRTMISILMGIFVGGIGLKISGYDPFEAYKIIFLGIFGNTRDLSYVIIRATPIILTGTAVAFAFKTGLFNIGAEGQYIAGTIAAVYVGFSFDLPPIIHPILALLAGALAGSIWASIVGFLKSKRGINEVLSGIMLNWIAFYLNNYMLTLNAFKRANSDSSLYVLDSAKITILESWKTSEEGLRYLSTRPNLQNFLRTPVNWGIIIAIACSFLIYYILKNTTLGYQLKAVGYNKHAAEYGGIDVEKNQIRAMAISGAIAGLAGAVQILGVLGCISKLSVSEGYGFDGMAVSLIAGNNPLATIPAGILFSGLQYGGSKLNTLMRAPSEIINIIIGIIIIFISMPKIFNFINKKKEKGDLSE